MAASGNAPLVLAPGLLFVLGNVVFSVDEAPDELPIAITQALRVSDLIGGKRVIQAMGTVWKPLKWEGYFFGINSQYRARLLSRMMAEATVQRLTYLSYALDVVIEEFTANYQHEYEIKYEIMVQVLNDASGVVSYANPLSVDAQITQAVTRASTNIKGMSDTITINGTKQVISDTVTPSFQAMSKALDSAGPAAKATGVSAVLASTSITNAITTAKSVLSAYPVSSTTTSLLNITQYINNLNVISKNFSTGQAPKTISLNGGSLYDVASQVYGNPALAVALQTANGLKSPILPSGVLSTIVLPPLSAK